MAKRPDSLKSVPSQMFDDYLEVLSPSEATDLETHVQRLYHFLSL